MDSGNPGSGNPSSGNPNASWFLYYLLSFVDNIYIPNWDSVLLAYQAIKQLRIVEALKKKGVHCPELCQFVVNTVFKVKQILKLSYEAWSSSVLPKGIKRYIHVRFPSKK